MYNTKFRIQTMLLLVAATATLFVAGCKKDKATESEVITKVVVHLTGIGNSFDTEFEAIDADGDGIFNTIDEIQLPVNTSFNCHIHVYDETKTPAADITEEIEAENTAHLFVFKTTLPGLIIEDLNTDDNGKPFGLESTWSTVLAGTGSVQIALHHDPTDKTAADPGGDVDFEVTFPVKVQ
ncbi:MAG: hypothetical protein KA138_13790 [Saprospiraceae bacterium]|jgi:hypothetical protein|nr:hypothetical protein [Saprospiraceae bacterium]